MKERKLGILGQKIGMTTVFNEGIAVGVSVLHLGPCIVLQKRTETAHDNGRCDGYNALLLGYGKKRPDKVNKPLAGSLKAAGGIDAARRFVMELRVPKELLDKYKVGDEVLLKDLGLQAGGHVDVMGQSKGKGFQGVMKRHNFGGFRATHGTHEYFRHGGSIGCRKWPGRVYKGRKMPGHMGARRVTTQNIQIVQVRDDEHVLLLKGAVPGHKQGHLMVRPAIK